MTVRCSNGAAFVVLEPEPAFQTGISIEVYDKANPLNLIDVLPDSFGRKWTDPRKGTGAGEFNVYANNPKVINNPTILEPGNIVRMYLDRVPRFAFKIEKRKLVQVGEGDDAAVAWHVSGRGVLSLLEDGQIYPDGGLAGSPERGFVDATPGELMLTLLDEAQARPNSILSQITEGFTTTEDYNNAPYTDLMTLEERAGTDLLRVADRISELAADVHMSPLLELRIYNSRGIDRTVQTVDVGPVVLQKGANILELERNEEAVIRNALLIETPGGFVERLEASSISSYRRREAYISLGNITDNDQIDKAAEAVFERSANPAESITIKVLDAEGRRPYVDFGVGDWVLSPDITGALERFRCNALTITELDDGTIEAIPELASLTDDLEERLAKWLKSMARGTMGGTAAEVTEPTQVTAEVAAAIDSNLSQHEATFLHPDELADLADVDVTGLQDLDLLQYDAGALDWVPLDLKVDLSTPATDEQVLIYDDGTGTWVPADQTGGGGGGGVQLAGNMRRTTDQAKGAGGSNVKVAFSASDFDNGGVVNLGSSRFEVPTGEAGIWRLTALLQLLAAAGETRLIAYVNGSQYHSSTDQGYLARMDLSASARAVHGTIDLNLNAGDYVEVFVYTANATDIRGTLNSWATFSKVGAAGGGGGIAGAYDIEAAASYADAGFSDEFDAGTLDGQWTAVNLGAGTVAMLTRPGSGLYDLATRPGSLLVQPKMALNAGLRIDGMIGSGEQMIIAMTTPIPRGADGANDVWVGLGMNNNDTAPNAGTYDNWYGDGGDDSRIIHYTGSDLGSTPLFPYWGGRIYWRWMRTGNNVHTFVSRDGISWTGIGRAMDVVARGHNNMWIFWNMTTWVAGEELEAIYSVEWVRHVANLDVDPW